MENANNRENASSESDEREEDYIHHFLYHGVSKSKMLSSGMSHNCSTYYYLVVVRHTGTATIRGLTHDASALVRVGQYFTYSIPRFFKKGPAPRNRFKL